MRHSIIPQSILHRLGVFSRTGSASWKYSTAAYASVSCRAIRSPIHPLPRLSKRSNLDHGLQARQRYSTASSKAPKLQNSAELAQKSPAEDRNEESFPLTDRDPENGQKRTEAEELALRKALSPAYQLWFTCKKCLDRSGHTVSKQSYHFGTTIIRCPKCKSQHLISDNLKIFSDTNVTMEDIMKQHGQLLRKGRLGADGDIEFYEDAAVEKVS